MVSNHDITHYYTKYSSAYSLTTTSIGPAA